MAATVNLAEGTTLSFLAGGTFTHDVTVTGDPIFNTNGNTVTRESARSPMAAARPRARSR